MGVRVVRKGAGSQFDPGVVEHFHRVVMPYPVGHSIATHSGRPAVVAGVDAERPERPLIRYRDESGRIREAVMQVVDGEVRDPALAAGDQPAADLPLPEAANELPAGAADHRPATGGSLRELDGTATR